MMGPGVLAHLAPPFPRLLLRLAAAGEVVVDKLPATPSRLAPGPLAGRLISGSICGVVLARRGGKSPLLGAFLGAAGALFGAFGGYHARHALTTRVGLPDLPVALAEDALAVGVARAVSR